MLALIFTRLIIYFIDFNVPKSIIYDNMLLFIFTNLLLFFIFFILMHYITNIFLIYLFFVAFLFFLASLLYPSFKKYESEINLEDVYLQVFLIFVIMTLLSIVFKNFLDKYGNSLLIGLFVALFAIVLSMIYNFLINSDDLQEYKKVSKIISILAVIVFSIFIAYDTNIIKQNALTCKEATYPRACVDLFLDLINILLNLAQIETLH